MKLNIKQISYYFIIMKKIEYFRFLFLSHNTIIISLWFRLIEWHVPTWKLFFQLSSRGRIRSRCVFVRDVYFLSFFLSIFSLLPQWMITAKPTRKSFFETSERVDVFLFFFFSFFLFSIPVQGWWVWVGKWGGY